MRTAPNLAAADRAARTAGFTLVETLVVLAVLGLLAAAAAPRVGGVTDGMTLRSAAHGLVADLRRLRGEAVDRRVAAHLAPADGGYALSPGGRFRALPAGVSLSVAPDAAPPLLAEAAPEGRVAFFPDGSSSGGTATLRLGRRAAAVEVRWLDGGVSLRGG